MQIDRANDCAVITLPEMVVIFEGAEKLKSALQTLFEEGYDTIELDFTQVIMLDTSGLSALLVCQNKLKARGGTLKIVNITSKYIRDMFGTIKLNTVIHMQDKE